ncbi:MULTISPECIES: endonuclease domain-containing protein [unclassified Leucobacter]|uniref:endonuclease domain-containing protein n=1 Tax=unclassified Leucobacter TaxID=2621730 RepID=UPI00165E201C|nr:MULTISPECIES: DUF559 domain-containing protein [unclassified Leucobacter]MBC9927574.1 DUF559 domain-containing protein [Leucobacter sp. cx-169]
MSVPSELRKLGGIARTATLLTSGFTRYEIAQAVARSLVFRVTRGWVALPNTDPLLLLAARHSVTISCISRAKRLGLWVFSEERTHVASLPNGPPLHDPRLVVHRHRPLVPRHPDLLEDSLVNTLVLVTTCVPHEEAVAIWDSALNKKLTDLHSLSQLALPARARDVLNDATPLADSGLETYLRQRLGWTNVPLKLQVWLFGHRVDALLGERLVLQVDGGYHVGAQRDSDNLHDAQLRLRGYTVIRISYRQLIHEWPAMQDLITNAIANGLHRAH